MSNFKTVTESDLRIFTENIFKSIGCSSKDAQTAADVLIEADLRGIDSHGVARLSGYIRLFENKRINPQPKFTIVREKKSIFTVDADSALGLVVAPFTMELILEKTEKFGSSYAAIQNSNHFGIAAYHAMKALSKDFIGMAMTNASPLVAPTYSKERMLGTNPICYAVPTDKQAAFVLDMATSAAANGKLEIAERQGKELPVGWLEDKNGLTSTNSKSLKEGGYLLPLGSDKDHGSHKGYGLGAIVDILSGVLSGANFGPWVPPFVSFLPVLPDLPGKGIGHFLGAMDVDGFIDKNEFKQRMDQWILRFKNAGRQKNEQEVIIHGEPEIEFKKHRQANGIPIISNVTNDLISLSQKYHLEHPFS